MPHPHEWIFPRLPGLYLPVLDAVLVGLSKPDDTMWVDIPLSSAHRQILGILRVVRYLLKDPNLFAVVREASQTECASV